MPPIKNACCAELSCCLALERNVGCSSIAVSFRLLSNVTLHTYQIDTNTQSVLETSKGLLFGGSWSSTIDLVHRTLVNKIVILVEFGLVVEESPNLVSRGHYRTILNILIAHQYPFRVLLR